jgi:hypothetical protein
VVVFVEFPLVPRVVEDHPTAEPAVVVPDRLGQRVAGAGLAVDRVGVEVVDGVNVRRHRGHNLNCARPLVACHAERLTEPPARAMLARMFIQQGDQQVPVMICDGCGGLVPETMLDVHAAYVHGDRGDTNVSQWLDSLDTEEITAGLTNRPISVGPVDAVLGVLRDKASAA